MYYLNSKHYLHKAYARGYKAGKQGEDYCPHVCGTKEADWWWAGWGDGVMKKSGS